MPPSLRPNSCSALENDDCPTAHTPLSQWGSVFHRPGFCSKTQGQGLAEAVAANSCWSLISSFPTGSRTSSLTQHICGSRSALGNEVCLWGNLMDPVVSRVGRRFVVADGHLMSPKLQENRGWVSQPEKKLSFPEYTQSDLRQVLY